MSYSFRLIAFNNMKHNNNNNYRYSTSKTCMSHNMNQNQRYVYRRTILRPIDLSVGTITPPPPRTTTSRYLSVTSSSASYLNDKEIIDTNDTIGIDDNNIQVVIIPSRILFQSVHVQYPTTLVQTLFSSTPRREYAIKNVNLQLGVTSSPITFFVGSSSSGKSTILKLILYHQYQQQQQRGQTNIYKPTQGTITIDSSFVSNDDNDVTNHDRSLLPTSSNIIQQRSSVIAKPIYLDIKPNYSNDYRTLYQILSADIYSHCQNVQRKSFNNNNDKKNNDKTINNNQQDIIMNKIIMSLERILLDDIIHFFAIRIFQLSSSSSSSWNDLQPNDLSPSELYRFQLLRSSFESMLSNIIIRSQSHEDDNTIDSNKDKIYTDIYNNNMTSPFLSFPSENIRQNGTTTKSLHYQLYLPSPILLLDEWLDKETSTIIHSIQKSLYLLNQYTNSICCIITHKLDRWDINNTSRSISTTVSGSSTNGSSNSCQIITLHSGELIFKKKQYN